MKKLLCYCLIFCIGFVSYAQQRATLPKELRNYAVKKDRANTGERSIEKFENPAYKSTLSPIETLLGDSYYDRQTNATTQNRLYYFDDGTLSATWMNGFENPAFADRGTAYTYYNGEEWSGVEETRIESQRSGWGNIQPLGENGELVISHISGGDDDGLLINRRVEKGTGEWEETLFPGPPGAEALFWPYCVTSGIDHNTIHLLAVTEPIDFGGSLYQGIDGALLYSRSTDGGETWDIQNSTLPQLSNEYFNHFEPDQYAFAEPRGGVIAFVVGGTFNEAFLMKSINNGDTWEKTMIWEHPYPEWNNEPVDTFFCIDGSWDIKLDSEGMAHCVFGINRARADGTGTFWFPFIDGVGYWNETMPAFSGTLEALNPYGDEGTELIEDYNLIGWSQDLNGNGEIDLIGTATEDIGAYYVGLSSMVQLVLDDANRLHVFYSSVTESYDDGLQNFRHLWSRVSPDGGTTWGDFTDLTEDIIHIFDECVWPVTAYNSSQNIINLIYQIDPQPGMAVAGDEDNFGLNYWNFMELDIQTGINPPDQAKPQLIVHQNFPNPFNNQTVIRIDLAQASPMSIAVVNIIGQKVYQSTMENKAAGLHSYTIPGDGLEKGIYFYTVKTENTEVTKKMIVE